MKVEFLVEKAEALAKRFPGLDPLRIDFDGVQVVIDLDLDDFKRVFRELPIAVPCSGSIIEGRLVLMIEWPFNIIGDVVFRTRL